MLVQKGIEEVTWANDVHRARLPPEIPGLASPANPRRSASAASSRMVERLVGVAVTDRAGIGRVVVIIRTVQPSQVAFGIVAWSEVGGAVPRRGNRLLRVAMVCPYSLSVPGGVQAQVMGL